jgi:hypothetical protein
MSRTHEMAWGMSTEEAVVWRLGRESLHEVGMCREWRCIGRCKSVGGGGRRVGV